jgi:hypothetical protein
MPAAKLSLNFRRKEARIVFDLAKLFSDGCSLDDMTMLRSKPELIARLMFVLAADLSIDEAARWAEGYLDAKTA